MAGDSKSLNNLASTLREQTPGTPEREAKLAELAARIRAGEYKVDEEKLADALMKEFGPSEPER